MCSDCKGWSRTTSFLGRSQLDRRGIHGSINALTRQILLAISRSGDLYSWPVKISQASKKHRNTVFFMGLKEAVCYIAVVYGPSCSASLLAHARGLLQLPRKSLSIKIKLLVSLLVDWTVAATLTIRVTLVAISA